MTTLAKKNSVLNEERWWKVESQMGRDRYLHDESRQTDRQTNIFILTDRQTDRQTERQMRCFVYELTINALLRTAPL